MNTARDPFSRDPNAQTAIVGSAPKATQPAGPVASEKQINFLNNLVQERDIETLSGNLYERAFDLATGSGKLITRAEASELIGALLKAAKVAPKASAQEPPEGIHIVYRPGEDPGAESHTIFKVQVAHHGSGKKYAKQLDPNTGGWSYVARAPFGQLSADTLMSLEQAKAFGHLYGMCIKCGRTLTDENSIAAGIGPICAESF